MIEYIFFDATLRDRFMAYAEQRNISGTAIEDNMGMVVAIPEEVPEILLDELEEYYDQLQDEQAEFSKETGDLKRLAGFRFNLPDGQSRMLPLQADMANRLMASFSLAEIQSLFDAVAHCTLNPNNEHLCKILATEKNS
ncbi:MAG: hypothetical protein Q7U37_10015 [Gallionella sp.]|nr:hypothetical protein [Gallionella sp.]